MKRLKLFVTFLYLPWLVLLTLRTWRGGGVGGGLILLAAAACGIVQIAAVAAIGLAALILYNTL